MTAGGQSPLPGASGAEPSGTTGIDHGPAFDLGSYVVAVGFFGPVALFATGEGEVAAATHGRGLEGRDRAGEGGILFGVPTRAGDALLIAGDDGKVRRVTLEHVIDVAETGGRWPTALAAGPDGALAVAIGRRLLVLQEGKPDRSFEAPSLVQGLAFAPKGLRVAATHKDGVSLWFPGQPQAEPTRLDWKGAHLDVTFSPDGAFLVTSMQEAMLHGWRLADGRHMRMAGYPGKTRALAWTAKGRWLATSGAEGAVLWPFQSKDGPMGKAPREMAVRAQASVTRIAAHPSAEVIAAGFQDGMVLLARITDGAELLAVLPSGTPISTLAFSPDGTLLAWGTQAGRAGLFPTTPG